nr:YitT family protein [Clostridia bacterium]
MKKLFKDIRITSCLLSLLGSIILAFGLYNVHSFSGVTEGGTLGLTLLLDHHFGISPSLSGFALNVLCYSVGIKTLGRKFIIYSTVSTAGFSLSYAIFEQFDPIFTAVHSMPLAAAILGAVFVGVGVGLCVRVGGAPSGDDALAMSLSKLTKLPIQWVYLTTDLTVLALSLTYIPLNRILYSLASVVLSGQIIGLVERFGRKKQSSDENENTEN